MKSRRHPSLPRASAAVVAQDLSEIAAVVALVRSRVATRVVLSGLRAPERAAARAITLTSSARVHLLVRRELPSGSVTIVVGPILG